MKAAPVQELRHLGHRFAACSLGQSHLREQVRAATLRFRVLRLHVSAHVVALSIVAAVGQGKDLLPRKPT